MIWDLPTPQYRFSLLLTFRLSWPPSLYPNVPSSTESSELSIFSRNFSLCSCLCLCLSRSLSPHLTSATTPIQKSSDLTSNISERPYVATLSKVRPQCFSGSPLLFGFFTALTAVWSFAWLFVSLLLIGNGATFFKLYYVILTPLNNKTKTPWLYISLSSDVFTANSWKGFLCLIALFSSLPFSLKLIPVRPSSPPLHETVLINVTDDPTLPNPTDNSQSSSCFDQ